MFCFKIIQYSGFFTYPILALLMFIEGGDATLLASGFLIRFSRLNFFLVFPITILAIFTRDIVLYKIGKKYGDKFIGRFGKFIFINQGKFNRIKNRLARHQKKTIFLSKFLYGLNHITIIAVGSAGIKFKDFLKINIITIVFWELIMLSLGFFLAHSFTLIRHYVRDFSIFLAFVVLFFIALEFLLRKLIHLNNGNNGKK